MAPGLPPVQGLPTNNIFKVKAYRTAILVTKRYSAVAWCRIV